MRQGMKHLSGTANLLLLTNFSQCPTKRSNLSAEPSVPPSRTDKSGSFDRESVSLSHVPTPVPQADETPRLEHKLLLVHKILFKMSHCLMYRITFPQSVARRGICGVECGVLT